MPGSRQAIGSPNAEGESQATKKSPASSVLGRLADAVLKGIFLYFAVQITLNCTFR